MTSSFASLSRNSWAAARSTALIVRLRRSSVPCLQTRAIARTPLAPISEQTISPCTKILAWGYKTIDGLDLLAVASRHIVHLKWFWQVWITLFVGYNTEKAPAALGSVTTRCRTISAVFPCTPLAKDRWVALPLTSCRFFVSLVVANAATLLRHPQDLPISFHL